MSISKVIYRARRMHRIKGGLVLCDNCDTPASKEWSQSLSWTACAPCATGISADFDANDLIVVPKRKRGGN